MRKLIAMVLFLGAVLPLAGCVYPGPYGRDDYYQRDSYVVRDRGGYDQGYRGGYGNGYGGGGFHGHHGYDRGPGYYR